MLYGDIETQPGPNSLTRGEFQKQFISRKGLKIMHQNIRGILSNFDMLQEVFVLHKNIDIVTLSETHLSEDNLIDLCELDGYTFLYRNRVHRKGGGVAIYIKNNIAFQHKHDIENSLECLWIEIFQKHSKSFLVVCYYCPRETSNYLLQNFNDLLQEQLSSIIKENKEIIILGDFKVNFNNSASNDFKSIINLIGLKHIIKQSTRITHTSSTFVDLIMTNRPSISRKLRP